MMAGPSAKAAVAKLNFTPEERALFGRLFRECDVGGSTVVTGEAAVKMFQRSRLSEAVLSEVPPRNLGFTWAGPGADMLPQIWTLADTENRGFLVQEDFAKAMRLVGQYQANPGISLRPELALSPGPLPQFQGINAPSTNGVSFQPASLQPQPTMSIRVPPLSTDRITEYIKLFERWDLTCTGELARMSFHGSGLGSDVLAAIWNLVDTEQRGSLHLTEFIIAMHLLASYKAKTMTALPLSIPAGLYEAASRRPGQLASSVRSSLSRTADAEQIPRQMSGQQSASSSHPRIFAPAGPADWAIGPMEKASYDELFNKIDTKCQGFISGEQAVFFFSHSGLPSEVLAAIWDLANIRRLDQLNRDEFAVAMYLIRNHRGKSQLDLPSELPINLVPPSLRQQTMLPQGTGLAYGLQPAAQVELQKSNTHDLFGLDGLSTSPVKAQTTGGSAALAGSASLDPFAAVPSSPSSSMQQFPNRIGAGPFFKPFAPTSSFGQTLAHQNSGNSSASALSLSRPSGTDDLLADNDPEASKKITQDSADLANMSNQINTTRTQAQALQVKKALAENELRGTSTQKADLEARLHKFRALYEQEIKLLKEVEDGLDRERAETQNLSQQVAMVQTSYQDTQTRQRELAAELENTQRENGRLKDRLRELNEFINRTRPEIEKMQSEQRQQRGLVAIQKKQVEKLQEEKTQVQKRQTESSDAQKEEDSGLSPISREMTGASVASTTSSTNPFIRRNTQPSTEYVISLSGFSRTRSSNSPQFDNIFHSAFSSPTLATAPTTSFLDSYAHPVASVRSSEPEGPTPSTSPPLSIPHDSSQIPQPAPSHQIASKDLLVIDKKTDSESLSTSARVGPSSNQLGFDAPTEEGSLSHVRSTVDFDAAKPTTGAAMFGRDFAASTSVNGSVPLQHTTTNDTLHQGPSALATGQRGIDVNNAQEPGKVDGAQDNSRKVMFPSKRKSGSSAKGDFEAAFESAGKPASTKNVMANDAVDKFHNDFPPIPDGAPANKAKGGDEFPPIAETELDESDSETAGFDDDFIEPPSQAIETAKQADSAQDPDFSFKPRSSPASAPMGSSANETRSAPTAAKDPDINFGASSSSSQGAALFGSSKEDKSASMYSTSSLSTNQTSSRSNTYESAVSQQSDADNASANTDKSKALPKPALSNPPAFDFSTGFEELDDANEGHDDDDDDDLMAFGSSFAPEHDFGPSFHTLEDNKIQTATGSSVKPKLLDSHFGKFTDNFGPPESNNASSMSTAPKGAHDWDAMMRGINIDHGGQGFSDASLSMLNRGEKLFTARSESGNKDLVSTTVDSSLPEAPDPPNSKNAISAGTENDDPILKKLVGMGFPRALALNALERYDYDLSKAVDHLSQVRAKE